MIIIEGLGIEVGFAMLVTQVTRWLAQIAATQGYPKMIRVDNGFENLSKHFRTWAKEHGVVIQYISTR